MESSQPQDIMDTYFFGLVQKVMLEKDDFVDRSSVIQPIGNDFREPRI